MNKDILEKIKINMEIEKSKAEIEKINAEYKEIAKRINTPWYMSGNFIQGFLAILGTIIIYSFFMDNYLKYIDLKYKAESAENSLELSKRKRSLEREETKNKRIEAHLNNKNEVILQEKRLIEMMARNLKETKGALEVQKNEFIKNTKKIAKDGNLPQQILDELLTPLDKKEAQSSETESFATKRQKLIDIVSSVEAEVTGTLNARFHVDHLSAPRVKGIKNNKLAIIDKDRVKIFRFNGTLVQQLISGEGENHLASTYFFDKEIEKHLVFFINEFRTATAYLFESITPQKNNEPILPIAHFTLEDINYFQPFKLDTRTFAHKITQTGSKIESYLQPIRIIQKGKELNIIENANPFFIQEHTTEWGQAFSRLFVAKPISQEPEILVSPELIIDSIKIIQFTNVSKSYRLQNFDTLLIQEPKSKLGLTAYEFNNQWYYSVTKLVGFQKLEEKKIYIAAYETLNPNHEWYGGQKKQTQTSPWLLNIIALNDNHEAITYPLKLESSWFIGVYNEHIFTLRKINRKNEHYASHAIEKHSLWKPRESD